MSVDLFPPESSSGYGAKHWFILMLMSLYVIVPIVKTYPAEEILAVEAFSKEKPFM